MNIPENYLPILIQIAVGFGFVVLCILGTHFLGPRQKASSVKKNESFECGVEVEGNARNPFSVKYFLTAILFVLFDIEIVFFYPYAVNIREFGIEGFFFFFFFLAVFFVAFIYVWKRGALDWDR